MPVDSPPGPGRDPLDPGVVVNGPVRGLVGGTDPVPGGTDDVLPEGPDVCPDGAPEDGAPPVEDPGPDVGPAGVDTLEPPELGPCVLGEVADGPDETDTEPGGVPGNVVVQPSAALEHGGGGGYGAVGAAAAVATTPPSRNINPATRNPAERARRTEPLRP